MLQGRMKAVLHPYFYLFLAAVYALMGADNIWQWAGGEPSRKLYFGVFFLICAPIFVFAHVAAARARKAAATPE